MAYWLFKEEPGCYTWEQLQRERTTIWDGVANNLALRHLRSVRKHDQVFFYASGGVKAILGIMRTVSDPYPDPKSDDPRLVVVEVEPLRPLPHPVTLAEIKSDPAFADWELVRISRLSVMPVSLERWRRIEALGGAAKARPRQPRRK